MPIDLNSDLKKGHGLKVLRKSSIFNYNKKDKNFNNTWDIVNEAIQTELSGAQVIVVKDGTILAEEYFGSNL